ncbi:MAG: MaoC family dehydratase, partial [Ruthenibacterium lactatiformans]
PDRRRNISMNSYTLADISPGLTADFTLEVTAEKMALFYELTGDCSPIHMDEAYAQRRGYPGRVVYGMLGASLFSTLAGVYLPGEHCLLHGVECKFARPVFIGDVLTVSGTVTEVNETFREITVKAVITNQNGQKVTRGVIRAGVAV